MDQSNKLCRIGLGIAVMLLMASTAPPAEAVTDCSFTVIGPTYQLDADCFTDATLLVPDGFTLDGRGHTILAVDPSGGHFVGAVVANGGSTAHVKNLVVTADMLDNVCDGGDDRLRGIMFDGASGSITHTTVTGINKGASGCQEGNAIEVRNAPFDGTHPDTTTVEVSHNDIIDYQKTGIVANGDVNVSINHNKISASATQENLAANSIQLGFGAMGAVVQNQIDGNQWKGTSDTAATAILLFSSDAANASDNNIRGNSDIGIYEFGMDSLLRNNRVFDEGADDPNSGYDIGIGLYGTDSTAKNNKVRGFDLPYDGVTGGKNKVIPGPQNFNP